MTQSQGGLLPLEQVTSISDYLPTTSRICFAIALTAPSKSFRQKGWKGNLSANSKAVLSSKEYWEIDFVEIDKYYTSGEPSDEDLHALLMYIDAKNTLKSLRFKEDRYKYNNEFTGSGLRALTGSTVLERLILPQHLSYNQSKDAIIHIICSIVNAVDNPLDRLDLTKDTRRHWMRDGYNGYHHKSPLREVLEMINELILRNRQPTICGDCENAINGACFTCFRQSCSECERPCDNCHITICYLCSSNSDRALCERCESVYCSECATLESVDAAVGCEYCSEKVCFECASTGGMNCTECPARHFTKMAAWSQAQATEINGLTEENEQLRRENEELRNRMRNEL